MWAVCVLSMALAQVDDDKPKGWVDGAPGKGVTVHSANDEVSVTVRSRFQLRGTVTAAQGEDVASEIIIRRARLAVMGHAYDPDLRYLMQVGFAGRDQESDLARPLLDAWVNYGKLRDLEVRAGQQIVPFSRGRMNSSSSFELVDRSIAIVEFNLDRDVGVQLRSDDLGGADERFEYGAGVFGGNGRNRLGELVGFLYAGRFALRPMGGFKDSQEGDLAREPRPKLAVGVSAGYNQNANRSNGNTGDIYEGVDIDYTHLGADMIFKWHGIDVSSEFLYRDAADDTVVDAEGATQFARSGYGWYVQSGQLVTKKVLLAERYGHVTPFAGTDPDLTEQQELGGGVTYLFSDHHLKVGADWFYLFGPNFADGEQQGRLEFQMVL